MVEYKEGAGPLDVRRHHIKPRSGRYDEPKIEASR